MRISNKRLRGIVRESINHIVEEIEDENYGIDQDYIDLYDKYVNSGLAYEDYENEDYFHCGGPEIGTGEIDEYEPTDQYGSIW